MANNTIRVRACLAVIRSDRRILLVPHFETDAGRVQWNLPGGKVAFGESLRQAAVREVKEETGVVAAVIGLLDVSEVIIPERPWHSVTITYLAEPTEGRLIAEADHPYGRKEPRWFADEELNEVAYHPASTIRKAMELPGAGEEKKLPEAL